MTTPTCPQGHASDDPEWCDVCGLAIPRAGGSTGAGSAPTAASSPVVQRCAACGAGLDGRFCETCGQDSEAPVPPSAPVSGPAAVPTPAYPAPAPAPASWTAPSTPVPAGPAAAPSTPAPAGPQTAASTPAPVPAAADPNGRAPRTEGRPWQAVVRADRAWFEEVRRQQGVDAGTLEFPRYAGERRFVLSGNRLAIGRRSSARGTSPEIDLTGLDPGISAAHALLVARPDDGWELVDVGSTNGTTLAVEDGPIPPHRPVPLADGTVIRLGAWTTITVTATPPP
jgi:FHA domain